MNYDEAHDDLDELPPRPRKTIPADDRELLELAARALGAVRVEGVDGELWLNLHFADGTVVHGWNPLLFYGDTFELAVGLNLKVDICSIGISAGDVDILFSGENKLTAAARAVVRAAAEIGKAMAC